MVDMRFFKNNGPFSLQQVAEICGAVLKNPAQAEIKIKDIANMKEAGEGEICFFYDRKKKEAAKQIKSSACITTEELAGLIPENVAVLTTGNPKLAYLNLNIRFYGVDEFSAYAAASARIAPNAKIGKGCFIGECAVIGENVEIGDNCIIEHGAVIMNGCKIGNNCRIGVNAYVSYCLMGSNCYVFSGARIGQDGFGFMMVGPQHKRIPQVGRVIIGNDVEIGANSCVDRGALDDTVIGDGCRVDNLVQIAHGDKLGRGCIIVGQAGIAGSTTVGDYCVIGGQVGIADHLNIGSQVQVASQSGVMRDLEPGAIVMGTPTVPIKDFMRQVSFLQKSANPKKTTNEEK